MIYYCADAERKRRKLADLFLLLLLFLFDEIRDGNNDLGSHLDRYLIVLVVNHRSETIVMQRHHHYFLLRNLENYYLAVQWYVPWFGKNQ